jgi:putative ATP-binding cassette transporter
MAPARRTLWSRFLTIARPFFVSEARWGALALLGLLLAFILGLGGLNVAASYMSRNFMTCVEQRHGQEAVHFALLWCGMVVAVTVVAVFKAFAEQRLCLWWRGWLTRHLFERYLGRRAYYRMKGRPDVDNPDQRITEDVRTFTENALALLLIIVNSITQLGSFAVVLWAITPWLLAAAVGYTLLGSLVTVLLGRKLIKLDARQFKKEADLRFDLMQVRTQAEPIALLGGETAEAGRLRGALAEVIDNMRRIIGLSRNISFFTMGYDYFVQVLPLFIVAPLFIRGQVEFGALDQARIAFAVVMGAFSIIVTQFQRISTIGAVTERLGLFTEVLEDEAPAVAKAPIETTEDDARVAFEGLTLVTPRDGRLLVKDLSVQVPRGRRLLVLGPSGSGRTCLLRAAAGLWTSGQGRIVRPPLHDLVFLPQQPYLRSGPLRDQFLYGSRKEGLSDERILAVLREVGFEAVLERVGGLDACADWANTLSLGEQQLVALARLLLARPRFAFLDEATSALDEDVARRLYEVLAATPISYVSVAGDPALAEYHDAVLELGPGGSWRTSPEVPRPARAVPPGGFVAPLPVPLVPA